MVKARLLFVCTGLLLLSASGVFADGGYQRTRDGKTFVWNNDPNLEDEATWSGERDADGYATGEGTLTWYRVKRKIITGSNIPATSRAGLISRCSGKMVHGKFEGQVVAVDAKGRTFHGKYVDGRRSGDWTAGEPKSKQASDTASEAREVATTNEAEEADRPQPEREVAANPPARGSAPATPRADTESASEPPPPAEGPASGPQKKSNQPVVETATTERPAGEMDDSLRSLVGPPTLLPKEGGAAATAPPHSSASPKTSTSSASAPAAPGPKLSAAEVVELANAEAKKRGYNVGQYQQPQAEFNAADATWSVSYDQKYADGIGKHFSVSVEDKTKKASIGGR